MGSRNEMPWSSFHKKTSYLVLLKAYTLPPKENKQIRYVQLKNKADYKENHKQWNSK